MDMSLDKLRELVMYREAWRAAIYGVIKSWTWLSEWNELTEHLNDKTVKYLKGTAWWFEIHMNCERISN